MLPLCLFVSGEHQLTPPPGLVFVARSDFLEVGTDDEALAIEVLQRREDMVKGNYDDHDDDSIIDDIVPTFALVHKIAVACALMSGCSLTARSCFVCSTGAESDTALLRQQGQS
jgi:hypothetical protein